MPGKLTDDKDQLVRTGRRLEREGYATAEAADAAATTDTTAATTAAGLVIVTSAGPGDRGVDLNSTEKRRILTKDHIIRQTRPDHRKDLW